MSATFNTPSRRRFVQGLAVAGSVGGAGLKAGLAHAASPQGPSALSGQSFDLVIDETPANVTGRPRMANTVNGTRPGPTLTGARATTSL